ncbi:MAG: hypothetical protein LC808_26325, partial [Actinobacteria bacterium]|nr:hypothetical protein [Actinomycetota bacterium]
TQQDGPNTEVRGGRPWRRYRAAADEDLERERAAASGTRRDGEHGNALAARCPRRSPLLAAGNIAYAAPVALGAVMH